MMQRTLARKVGRHESTVGKWIKGDTQPSLDDLAAISRVIRCSVDWLLGLTDEVPDAVKRPMLEAEEVERRLAALESRFAAEFAALRAEIRQAKK